jgi:hypothetical protein
MTLGFDASMSTCGWAFVENGEIKDCGFIDISKYPTNKEKALHVIQILNSNTLIKSVDKINLEAALSGFAGGFTSQQVIIKLARFNALFEYIISEHWNLPVNLLSVNTARKQVFGKCRIKGIKSKDFVFKEIHAKFPDIKKFEKVNKKNNWDIKNADMFDAIVIACA